jgi:hypothetical protein
MAARCNAIGAPVPIISSTEPPVIPLPPPLVAEVGLEPLETARSRWPTIIAGLLTIAMLVGLGRQLFGSGLAALTQMVPRSPLFYVAFAGTYFTLPVFDYLIFRKLWGIPLSGLAALIKKRIANDVLVGYSGEAYFYAWARARAQFVAAPFGAVKDVTILSAIAGNAITLAMIAVALPVGQQLIPPAIMPYIYGSLAVVFATSLPFLIFSKRVFSLSRRLLWWVFGAHMIRSILSSLFLALAWHFALPDVSIGVWIFLTAARLLFARLPLLPNKDLLFANFAILFIGQEGALSNLIAFTAAAVLLVHVVLIVAFGLYRLAIGSSK